MYLAVMIAGLFFGGLDQLPIMTPASDATRPQEYILQDGKTAREPFRNRSNPACSPLALGQTVKRTISSARPACFSVAVQPGEATQLVADQADDLLLRLTGNGTETILDGFEFGEETLTIHTPGLYRVEVRPVAKTSPTLPLSMSRRIVALQVATAWQEAEVWATTSKGSQKLDDLNKSLNLWSALEENPAIARTYLKLGARAIRAGEPAAGRQVLAKALQLCSAMADIRCSAEGANNSGFAALQLGEVDDAGRLLEEAAKGWLELHDLALEARTRSNLGLLYRQSGDIQRAISAYDLAGAVLKKKDAVGYALVLNNLGVCYLSLADYATARRYFERAITEFQLRGSGANEVRARLNLGRAHMLDGNLAQAQRLLEDAASYAFKLSDPAARADALVNLGQDLWRLKKFEESREKLEEALAIFQAVGDKRGQSSALNALGQVAHETLADSDARAYLARAIQLRRDCGLRDGAADSLLALANLEYDEGNLDAARAPAEQALKLLESVRSDVPGPALRASFYSRKRQFFDLLVDIAMSPGNPNAAADGLLAVERGRARALMDMLAGGSLLQQIPPDLAERRSKVQRRLDYLSARLSGLAAGKDAETRRQVEQAVAEDAEIEARIRQSLADQKLGQPLESIEDLQRKYLPENSALIEYQIGVHSHLWLVERERIRVFPLPPSDLIEKQASRAADLFSDIGGRRRSPPKQAAFRHAMQDLSATLLGSLKDTPLPPLLILVPDGVLHRVPFAALELPDHRRLGLAHDLVQIPAASYLMVGRKPRPIGQFPKTILAITDPVFSRDDPRVSADSQGPGGRPRPVLANLARLPFTAEIDTIESMVPGSRRKTLRGLEVNRENLGKQRLEDFAVVHFSTHALIDDRIPEISRIALSMVDAHGRPMDGFLRTYQFGQFHMDGSTVVLSACDTALGKQVLGEGFAGLTSSLLYAGAAQLVLTITAVDAEASSRFLSETYRRFLPGNVPLEHALTLARRSLERSANFSDPYYWASFVVIARP